MKRKGNKRENYRNVRFSNAIVIKLTFVIGFAIALCSAILLILIPFVASLIRDIARSVGYGSAKRFYFVLVNIELFLILIDIFLFFVGIFILGAGYLISKRKF